MSKKDHAQVGCSNRKKGFYCGTAVTALLVSGFANAQDAAPASSKSMEEVVVTGTQIRGATPVGSSLITISRDQIELTGAITIQDILLQQPEVFNYGIAQTQRTGTGGANNITYANAINLRGLSPFATLTLIDGRRAVPTGTTADAVDPTNIPTLMLQNIAIVPDGSSATYGSDAIAGVVNLILRRNVEGVEASARGGWADSYNENQFDIVAGHQWDSGQFTIGFERNYNSNLNGTARSFFTSNQTAFGGPNYDAPNCNPGTIVVGGQTYAIPAGGVTPATASSLIAGTRNLCEPMKYMDLIPKETRYSVAATFDQRINSWLSVFADAHFSRRDAQRRAPLSSGPLTVTNVNPYFVAPPGSGATSETVDYWFGGQGLGNNYSAFDFSVNEQITVGADIKLGGDWVWETDGSYGYNHDYDQQIMPMLGTPPVNAALASSNPATALNPFGANSTALLQSFEGIYGGPGISHQMVAETKLDGTLFSLPGGAVRAAVGAQYQRHTLVNGTIRTIPQGTGTTVTALMHLSRDENSFFGELLVPIIGDGNAMPGVQALSLDVGARYTSYTVVGSTTNPKVGIDWTVSNGLKLHGSYGTSFRAPLLAEQVGPTNAVFVQTYATSGGPVSAYTLAGGNRNLKPETATTWSVGGDWTPDFAPNWHVGLNYFNIKYQNQITNYQANLSLLLNPSKYASLITFCPSTACTNLINKYILGIGPNPDPRILNGPLLGSPAAFIDGTNENLASTITNGIDFQIDYALSTGHLGNFKFGLGGTYFTQFDVTPTPGAPVYNELNRIGFPLQFRFRGNVVWDYNAWTTAVYLNYANSYVNDSVTPAQNVSEYTTVDLHVSYDLGKGFDAPWLEDTRLSVDVTNLFDTQPPYVNGPQSPIGGGGWDPQNASPIGRLVAVGVGKKF